MSPLLFVIAMEATSFKTLSVALPWELLYAGDLVVIAETEEDLIKRLNEWNDNAEHRGMRVNVKVVTFFETHYKWRMSEANAEACKIAMWCVCGRGVGTW